MILAGNKSKEKISNEEIAKLTIEMFKKALYLQKFQELLFYLEVNQKLKQQKI